MRRELVGTVSVFVALLLLIGLTVMTIYSVTIQTEDNVLDLKPKVETGSSSVRPPINRNFQRYPRASRPTNSRTSETSSNGWVYVALIILSLATLIATAISFYLYRWRRILLSNPHLVVPEQLGEWVNSINAQVIELTNSFSYGVKHLSQQSDASGENISNLTETFMTLQHALDERDAEIRRLKRGYDAEIFRKFITRFIRVGIIVEDFQRAGKAEADDLEHISRLLEDAFSECNVESFHPEIGTDYRSAHGVADSPKTGQNLDPNEAFKIIEILESGYQLSTSEGYEVLVPAKVKINAP
jgi:hypothetical protein